MGDMSLLFEFTFLDWMILVLLVVSIVSSILKGFARETISLVSVIVGLVLASWFFPLLGHFFGSFVKTQDIA
jgi:uncharacterized membrane protein required for colicin V production